jgi:hypothetical protein
VGEHRTLGGFCRVAGEAMVSPGRSRALARPALQPTKETIMNRSPTQIAVTCLAVTAIGLGLSACSTPTAHTPPRTLGPTAASAAAAVPTAPATAAPEPTTAVIAPTPRIGPARSPCTAEQDWSINAKSESAAVSQSALYLTRVGQHPCYDRVVFDIIGPEHNDLPEAVGFAARYVPVVTADGSGEAIPVAGHAVLEVTIRAPIYGTDNQGHQPWRLAPSVGQSLVAPAKIAGWSSLAAVTFAGSFEGQTTLAVGVRETRPFRVWVSSEQGNRHVVLDIAH